MRELREYIAYLFNYGLNDKEIAEILFVRAVSDENLVAVIRSLMSDRV